MEECMWIENLSSEESRRSSCVLLAMEDKTEHCDDVGEDGSVILILIRLCTDVVLEHCRVVVLVFLTVCFEVG